MAAQAGLREFIGRLPDGSDTVMTDASGGEWQRIGNGVDGSSSGRWTTLRYSYDAGGSASEFRFRYQTDGGVHLKGAFLDSISVNGVVDDNAFTGTIKWIRLDVGTDDHGHLIDPQQLLHFAMSRQ